MTLNSVVLPAPFGPMMALTPGPMATCKETSLKAATPPNRTFADTSRRALGALVTGGSASGAAPRAANGLPSA